MRKNFWVFLIVISISLMSCGSEESQSSNSSSSSENSSNTDKKDDADKKDDKDKKDSKSNDEAISIHRKDGPDAEHGFEYIFKPAPGQKLLNVFGSGSNIAFVVQASDSTIHCISY